MIHDFQSLVLANTARQQGIGISCGSAQYVFSIPEIDLFLVLSQKKKNNTHTNQWLIKLPSCYRVYHIKPLSKACSCPSSTALDQETTSLLSVDTVSHIAMGASNWNNRRFTSVTLDKSLHLCFPICEMGIVTAKSSSINRTSLPCIVIWDSLLPKVKLRKTLGGQVCSQVWRGDSGRDSAQHSTQCPQVPISISGRVQSWSIKESGETLNGKVYTAGVSAGVFRMTRICQISVAHLCDKPNEGEGHSKARQGKSWGNSKMSWGG